MTGPNTSKDLFNKIRSKFSNIQIGDMQGMVTANPEDAVFFDFEFVEDADTFGRVSISLADNKSMKVFFSRDLVERLDDDSTAEWYDFLKELKDFSVAHRIGFDVRDITKSNLTKQDFKSIVSSSQGVSESADIKRVRTSYESLDKTRLIIRHKEAIDPSVKGARSRRINSLFIENADGERFKYPLIHLNGARAMTRHVANGGNPYDSLGQHIISISEQIAQLASFQRYVSNKDQLNDSAGDIIQQARLKLETMRKYIKGLSSQKNYESIAETFDGNTEQKTDLVDNIREKFTITHVDERVEQVLPILSTLVVEFNQSQEQQMQAVTDFVNSDSKIELEPDDAADEIIKKTSFKDTGAFLTNVLKDISQRIVANSEVAEFAKHLLKDMESQDTMFGADNDEFQQRKQLGVALAKKYLKDFARRKITKTTQSTEEHTMSEIKQDKADQLVESFERWIDSVETINEGTWALPTPKNSGENYEKLETAMSKPVPVGVNAMNAINVFGPLGFGDDQLYDDFGDLEDNSGADADARVAVYNYVNEYILPAGYFSQHLTQDDKQQLKSVIEKYAKDFNTAPQGMEEMKSLISQGIEESCNDEVSINETEQAFEDFKRTAADAAANDQKEFEYPKGSGKMHPVTMSKNVAMQMLADDENIDDGISAEELKDVILNRMQQDMSTFLGYVKEYGPEAVLSAVEDEASFHAGTTELGTGDVSAMVNGVKRLLGVTENKLYDLSMNEEYGPEDDEFHRGLHVAFGGKEDDFVPHRDRPTDGDKVVLMVPERFEKVEGMLYQLFAKETGIDQSKMDIQWTRGQRSVKIDGKTPHPSVLSALNGMLDGFDVERHKGLYDSEQVEENGEEDLADILKLSGL